MEVKMENESDVARIIRSSEYGFCPKDACAVAKAYNEAIASIRALREENAQLRTALEHLEMLRERDMATMVPEAPKTVEIENPLEFDDEQEEAGAQEEEG